MCVVVLVYSGFKTFQGNFKATLMSLDITVCNKSIIMAFVRIQSVSLLYLWLFFGSFKYVLYTSTWVIYYWEGVTVICNLTCLLKFLETLNQSVVLVNPELVQTSFYCIAGMFYVIWKHNTLNLITVHGLK